MRAADVLVRPRYAPQRTDVVAGYSVALRPQRGSGEGPIWYGVGGSRSISACPRCGSRGPIAPDAASAAVAEWNAANRHRRVAAPGRERQPADGQHWGGCNAATPADERSACEHPRRGSRTVGGTRA